MYHVLSAVTLLGREERRDVEAARDELEAGEQTHAGSPEDYGAVLFESLGLLIPVFRAERAFIFGKSEDHGPKRVDSLGPCLASRDLDGESIQQPERRAPVAEISKVLKTGSPAFESKADGVCEAAPGAGLEENASRFIALPVIAHDEVLGVVYLENRFQPLELSRENLRLARVHTLILGNILELDRIRKENESLWVDFQRLREERPPLKAPVASRSSKAPARTTKRKDLKGDYASIVGSSPRLLEIFQVLDRIASSNAPVLIHGESGTGKELIAQAVHSNSPRRGKVFVSENCGALTETLLESELFGYMRGAFTGASKDHKGLFELAESGTLFLDEVGDMSPGMQKKLLRVLQEGVIRRVGGKEYIPVNVRIISATNKDLLEEVRSGNFREDLYYRLNVINLKLPPLRERKEDIPEIIEHLLAELCRETGVEKKIQPAVLERLVAYSWPGNIRELKNEMKRFHTLSDGDIAVEDLSEAVLMGDQEERPFHDLEHHLYQLTLKDATERLEREMIRNAMVQSRGNKSLMAKMLQIPKTSLYNKIHKYGLDPL